jgi:hypothetical protein
MMATKSGSRWRVYEFSPGDRVVGRIIRLPQRGRPHGNRLFLELLDGKLVALPATARAGRSVLERELREKRCAVGDAIEIAYHGRRLTQDAEPRAYHLFEVTVQ